MGQKRRKREEYLKSFSKNATRLKRDQTTPVIIYFTRDLDDVSH